MNVPRIASSAALALALVATASPAWAADGHQAAGSSGVASRITREYARNPQPVAGVPLSPRAAYSWSHDSRIPTQRTPTAGTSWDHDSRIPTQRTPTAGTSWDHDSHWAGGTSATGLRRTAPAG